MSNGNYSLFEPDKNRLDEEWIKQPRLFREASDKLADAKRDHAQAKAAMDVVKAELAKEIREDPASFGLEGKVSGVAIDSLLPLQKRYRKAQQVIIDAAHAEDVLDGMAKALRDRRGALENLVQLWLASYFSSPRIPGDAGRRMKDAEATAAFDRKGARK